jgi:hypothetical protein
LPREAVENLATDTASPNYWNIHKHPTRHCNGKDVQENFKLLNCATFDIEMNVIHELWLINMRLLRVQELTKSLNLYHMENVVTVDWLALLFPILETLHWKLGPDTKNPDWCSSVLSSAAPCESWYFKIGHDHFHIFLIHRS